ncbi:MAG TPA: universal stress protein [Candidatus Eremiobacteraceae bacterium]|nr:universal stress protein [Candidatus Eremiobacteraceae bacterium]
MPVFKKIVVPVDGSAPSNAAAALAISIGRDQKAQIVFLNVCETARIIAMMSTPAVGADPSLALTAEKEAGDQALAQSRDAATAGGISFETKQMEGGSVDTILSVADSTGADLIVIGSHGRGGIARAVLGSVAEGVMRRSRVPVLITHVAAP